MNIYYHRHKRTAKSANSFPAPRKSVKVVLMYVMITVTELVRVTNKGVVAATKQQNTFVKNVTFYFILNVSKYFIKNNYFVIGVYKDFELNIALWNYIYQNCYFLFTFYSRMLLILFIILFYFVPLYHKNKYHLSCILGTINFCLTI